MVRKLCIWGISVLTLVCGAFLLVRPERSKVRAAPSSRPQSPRPQELVPNGQLLGRVLHISEEPPASPREKPTAKSPDDEPSSTAANDEVPPAEARAAAMARDAARMDELFRNDRPATQDTRAVEVALRTGLQDPLLRGVRLERAECRATTCRAEVTYTDVGAAKAAVNHVLVDPQSSVSLTMGFIVPVFDVHTDGTVSSTIYLYAPEADPTVAIAE